MIYSEKGIRHPYMYGTLWNMGGNIEGLSGDISKRVHRGIVVVWLKWFKVILSYISVKIK